MLDLVVMTIALAAPPAVLAAQGTAASPRPPRMDREEAEEFLEEVGEYLEHRRKAREELPKLREQAEPEEVTAYAKQLSDNIRARRRGAKPGDVFKPKLARGFKRVVAHELRSGH